MCGRFAVTSDPARLAVQLDAVDETGLPEGIRPPNYNVAPSTDIAALVARHDETRDRPHSRVAPLLPAGASRRIRLMRWGLVPPWAKAGPDGRIKGPQLINARAETVTTSPAYRAAAKHKRCLIPMDGYYEWKPNADDPKRGRKTPYYFYRPDGAPLMVAGLWSVWRPGWQERSDLGMNHSGQERSDLGMNHSGQERSDLGMNHADDAPALLTCTVITTDAVGDFATIHDRMPLSLAEADWDRWLNPDSPAPTDLLTAPPDVTSLGMREVSTLVNNVANNGPELIGSAGPGNQPVGLF